MDIVDFIEQVCDIKLLDYQKTYIKELEKKIQKPLYFQELDVTLIGTLYIF